MKKFIDKIWLIILSGLVIYLLFTFFGKNLISSLIINHIQKNSNPEIQITDLSISPQAKVIAKSINLDTEKNFFKINNIKIYPKIGKWFKPKFIVHATEVILKLPISTEKIMDTPQSSSSIFLNTEFVFDKIIIIDSTNKKYYFSLNGQTNSFNNKLFFNLNLNYFLEQQKSLPISIDGVYKKNKNLITIKNLSSINKTFELLGSGNIILSDHINYNLPIKIKINELENLNNFLLGNLSSELVITGINNLVQINGSSSGELNLLQNPIDLSGNYSTNIEFDNNQNKLIIKNLKADYPFAQILIQESTKTANNHIKNTFEINNLDLNKISNNLNGVIDLTGDAIISDKDINIFNLSSTGSVVYNNYSPINLKSNIQGKYQNKNLIIEIITSNDTKTNIKSIIDNEIIDIKSINIEDKYKNKISGNLQIATNSQVITGDLSLQGDKLDTYQDYLGGVYNAKLKLNNPDNKNQNYELLINRSPSNKIANLKIFSKGLVNFSKEYFEIKTLTGNYNGSDLTSDRPIKLIKEHDNYQFDISNLRWKNKFYLSSKGNINNNNISAKMSVNFPVEAFFDNILTKNHFLIGNISADLSMQGSASSPKLTGTVDFKDITYKYLDLGLSINNLSAHLVSDGNRLVSKTCKVYDVSDTSHPCNVNIELSNPLFKQIKLALKTNDFFINLPSINLQGYLNTDIELTSSLSESLLSGTLYGKNLEIQIPQNIVPNIPELNIVEPANKKHSESSYPFIIKIHTKIPNSLHIIGRGVDAILGGTVSILTDNNRTSLEGKLSSVKGTYKQFDKEFSVTRGDLVFHGTIPPSPFLEIEGLLETSNANLYATLTGPLLNPEILLYSKPSLETEEILSLILFNKPTEEISPLEAIMLGNDLRKVSGKTSNNFDLMGKTKKLLRIDELKLLDKEDETKSLQIGKRLGDRLTVRLEKNLKEGPVKTFIEYELSPSITIDGGFGEENSNGIGVNWKKDF